MDELRGTLSGRRRHTVSRESPPTCPIYTRRFGCMERSIVLVGKGKAGVPAPRARRCPLTWRPRGPGDWPRSRV
jgi:hypothetical protein